MSETRDIEQEREDRRLASLDAYEILDTAPEEAFDELTAAAADAIGVPIALVSLVDRDRQWFKSRVGLDATETPRDISFCTYAVADADVLLVPDAHEDPRFRDNPLVTDEPNIRFYAGVPIRGREGLPLGTLCVIDREPREVDPRDLRVLETLARQAELQLELRRELLATQQRARTLEQFFALSPDLLCIADTDGYFRKVSPAFTTTLRYSEEELLATPFLDFVHPEDREATRAELRRLADGEQTIDFENRYRTRSGEYRYFSWRAAPDPSGVLYAAARDITDEAELRASRQLLAMLVESSQDAIIGCGPDGRIKAWNRGAATLYGYSEEWIAGRPYSLLRPDADALLARVATGEPVDICEELHERADGTQVPVRVSYSPIDVGDSVHGIAVVARDISALKELDRAKDEFIGIVSHELRTPLTSIRGALGLLVGGASGELTEAQSKLLGIALKNSDRLIRLINDILSLEKIRSGKIRLDRRRSRADLLLAHAVESVQGMGREQGIALTHRSSSVFARATVLADEDRIQQVLSNLLSNAIKFSSDGGEVDAWIEVVGREVGFHVRDRGAGIPADQLEQVFDRFHQVDGGPSRNQGGTGLGLAICKAIAEEHGGRIEVASEVGVGSVFTLWLAADRQWSRPLPQLESRTGNVLLVEDDSDLASLLMSIIDAGGNSVRRVGTVASAIAALEDAVPDVIVLDLGLPDGCGTQVLSHIQQRESLAEVPVIIASGRSRTEEVGDAALVDWITKPFSVQRLIRSIRRALDGRSEPLALLVEDDDDTRLVVGQTIEEMGVRVQSVSSGEAALDVLRAQEPDLIVLDVEMPGLNGFDVVRALRAAGREIPLLVYSANEWDRDDREALRLGLTRYLVKAHSTPQEFEAAVRELLAQALATTHEDTDD